jgi:alkanesulfonate monooxygenase
MTPPPIRFGIWALVHGSRAALQDPDEPYDASWERNRKLILEAEALGFDSTLVAQHTINPHHAPQDQLEAWTASAALAALTSRIEIIAAIKPYLYHPVVLAKMALGIEHISRGRFAINLVNAWNRPELEKAGIGFAEHDERYVYGREWLSVVEPLMRGRTLNHHRRELHRRRLYVAARRSLARPPADLYRRRIRTGARAGRRYGRRVVHQRPADRGRHGSDQGCRRPSALRHAVAVRAVRLRDRPPHRG